MKEGYNKSWFFRSIAFLAFDLDMRPDIYSLRPLPSRFAPPQFDADLASLLTECGLGDTAALARLHRLVTPRLRRYAMRLTSQHDIVDDIVQESIIAIWRQAATYEPRFAGPMTWMSAIVRHKTFDHFRAQRVRTEADCGFFADSQYWETVASSPCSAIETRQRADEIALCMQRLHEVRRTAIELAYMQDLTHEEVAEKMAKPLGTIKTWIRRGVLDLRRQMGSTTLLRSAQRTAACAGAPVHNLA